MKIRNMDRPPHPEDNSGSSPASNPLTQAVAAFEIGDELYFVCPLDKDGMNSAADVFRARDGQIVGQFKTRHHVFAVVLSTGAFQDSSAGEAPQPISILTRRELQIVTLVAEGRINKEIADKLRISEWTVSTHLRRIFAKLKVGSRAAMVSRCSNLLGLKKASAPNDSGLAFPRLTAGSDAR